MEIVKSEFYRAAYWSFQGFDVRLSMHSERAMPASELIALAFSRARNWKLEPLYMRISIGEFLVCPMASFLPAPVNLPDRASMSFDTNLHLPNPKANLNAYYGKAMPIGTTPYTDGGGPV